MTKLHNPCGLDGFSFLAFSSPNQHPIEHQFDIMGFTQTSAHQEAPISLYQQGDIQFILNATEDSQAARHAKTHGPGACAMGFRVSDVDKAFTHAIKQGAVEFVDTSAYPSGLPAIEAIGGSVIYFTDQAHQPYANQWQKQTRDHHGAQQAGLRNIDHLTHNVYRGNMDKWADFYEALFNFKQIRFFNIVGSQTGLISRALGSPCGKIKIPLNESKDDKSQIEEFLHDYQGEGIQHIALSTDNIYQSISSLKDQGLTFLDVPDTYYDMIADRIPWHQESIEQLKARKILIDGEKDPKQGLLLQIFTENALGPVFFEIIQRKGNQGFGEGNFQALFEAIERDQIRRGTL